MNHATAKTTAPTSTRRFFASDDFAKRYGKTSPFDLLTEVNRYTLYDVVDKITPPMLITDPEDEQFFPGQKRNHRRPAPERQPVTANAHPRTANRTPQDQQRHRLSCRVGGWRGGFS